MSDRNVSALQAFHQADQVLLSGVQGITDLITTPGLINLDFADVKSVMQGAGSALMGIGNARGDDRAVQAAEMAISSPLLEASIDGAHGVLLSIQGGSDLGLFEINEAARLVHEAAHTEANIIFGAVIDDALGDEVRVTVIAAGFDGGAPQVRGDARALGQVAGAQRPATSAIPVVPAARAVPPAPTPGAPTLPRPVVPIQPEADDVPVTLDGGHGPVPVQPVAPAPFTVVGSGDAGNHNAEAVPGGQNEGVDVPPRIFDEEPPRRKVEELDVPDFLK